MPLELQSAISRFISTKSSIQSGVKIMKSIIEILLGLLLILTFVWAVTYTGWWQAVKDVIQGGFLLGILGLGLILIFIGISELRD